MKSNLHSMFKTSATHETQGVWFEIAPDVSFHLRRFGGANSDVFKQAMAKYHKPYARLIQNNSLPAEKETEIMTKVFIDVSLVDWKGVEIDGKEAEYSKENALKLFTELPELASELVTYASEVDHFREDLGNS